MEAFYGYVLDPNALLEKVKGDIEVEIDKEIQLI